MKKTLNISKDLKLPLEAITEKQGFLGRTGQGKSYAAQKEAELMLDVGAQIVVLDPVGIWWGLRLAADGKKPGYAIPVFGGLHGDVPLEPSAGALIADLIVDKHISAIVDVSQFESDSNKSRFATDFADRFFFRKKQKPSAVHIFLEEAQEFTPQNPQREEARMLHAFTRLFKIGRNFGIGGSLISQRPQEVNKKVMNLAEILFVFQLNGKHERRAVKEWIEDHAIEADINAILPKLKRGHPHVWSPVMLGISRVVSIAEKWTFDASATPIVGASQDQTRELAPIDIENLRKHMTATIERAKQTDPREMMKEIAHLKKQLASKPDLKLIKQSAVKIKTITKPVIGKRTYAKLQSLINTQRKQVATFHKSCAAVREVGLKIADQYVALENKIQEAVIAPRESLVGMQKRNPLPVNLVIPDHKSIATVTPSHISRPCQKILNVLSSFSAIGMVQTSRQTIAAFCRVSPNSSGFEKNLSTLRTSGFIEYPGSGTLRLTDVGHRQAQPVISPASLRELHDGWCAVLSRPQAAIVREMIARYPNIYTRDELSMAVCVSSGSSGFEKNISKLRTCGAIEYPGPGMLRASTNLFPEGLK